jgi:hypothetical protein
MRRNIEWAEFYYLEQKNISFILILNLQNTTTCRRSLCVTEVVGSTLGLEQCSSQRTKIANLINIFLNFSTASSEQ